MSDCFASTKINILRNLAFKLRLNVMSIFTKNKFATWIAKLNIYLTFI